MEVTKNYILKDFSHWKVGGIAKLFIVVNNAVEFAEAIEYVKGKGLKPIIIGRTSNILFDEGELNIGLIKLGGGFFDIGVNGNNLTVGAAVSSQSLVRFGHKNGLVGLEHLIGIPATVGGLVYMNGGSNRKTISERILSVTSINVQGELISRANVDCAFTYRKSIFQNNSELITSVVLNMDVADNVKNYKRECLNILKERNSKFPRKLPSCGSVFISYPDMYNEFGPPGKIIESLGLKGTQIGGAEISPKHANFIVNNGGAKANDILELINIINSKVEKYIGRGLESEGIFVSNKGEILPLHLAASGISK